MSLTDSHVVDSMTSSTKHHQVRAKIRRQFQNKKGIKAAIKRDKPGCGGFDDGPSVGEGHGVEPCDHECEDRR